MLLRGLFRLPLWLCRRCDPSTLCSKSSYIQAGVHSDGVQVVTVYTEGRALNGGRGGGTVGRRIGSMECGASITNDIRSIAAWYFFCYKKCLSLNPSKFCPRNVHIQRYTEACTRPISPRLDSQPAVSCFDSPLGCGTHGTVMSPGPRTAVPSWGQITWK